MGTRKNRKNRKRKTKRKLIKGDPITFLKNLKTPEQIRKHSLFKKRTVKRNMRGGGQPDKPTRKKNIKKLIKKINDEYKTNTEWTLKNIEEQYVKAGIKPGFLKTTFINTNQQEVKEEGESISDKLSICSKWNNVRKKKNVGKSGPYLDNEGNIKKGNLSAKEALACAYWSYHKKTKDPKKPIRQIEITPNRGTDIADGVYFPPSFLRAAGYQYNKFSIKKDTKEAKNYDAKSKQDRKKAAELAAKAKLEAEKSAAIAADCETNYDPTTKKTEKYCIGYLINGKDYTDRITTKWKKSRIPPVTGLRKAGIILGHLNYGASGNESDEWNGPPDFSNQVSKYNKLMSSHQSNPNLYIVLYFKGGSKKLSIGIFGEAELNNNIDDWNNNMKKNIESLLPEQFKNKFDNIFTKPNGPQMYTKAILKLGKNKDIKDNLEKKITDSIKLLGSIGKDWKDFLEENWKNGSFKMRKYLSEKTYEISDIIMLIKKK